MVDFRGKKIKLGDIGIAVFFANGNMSDGCEVVDIQYTQVKVFNDDWIVKRRVINPNHFIVME